ncbi:hypothetical protein INT45_013006, partial [Circinella minor]
MSAPEQEEKELQIDLYKKKYGPSNADHLRFWKNQTDSIIIFKAGLGCTELIIEVTEQQIESLQTDAGNNRSQTAASLPSESSSSNDAINSSEYIEPTPTTSTISSTSCAPNEPISVGNLTFHQIQKHLTNIRKSFINEEQINNEPYTFKDVNVSCLFSKYNRPPVFGRYKCLPIEILYELALLAHFFLCKNQDSVIAEKIFTLDLLKELSSTPEVNITNVNLCFPLDDFMTITTAITNLSLEKITRKWQLLTYLLWLQGGTMDQGGYLWALSI